MNNKLMEFVNALADTIYTIYENSIYFVDK